MHIVFIFSYDQQYYMHELCEYYVWKNLYMSKHIKVIEIYI